MGAYLEVVVPAYDVVVAGVYVPVISAVSLAAKRRFWGMLHDAARRRLEEPYVLVGDLNTGDFPIDKESPGRPFSCTREYRQMRELGLVEAWRAANGDRREYSWRSRQGIGFRIDHAFLSPRIRARLTGARYSHGEREAKISDHSILIVDLAPAAVTGVHSMSLNKNTVHRYIDGFNKSDHAQILSCLTDEIEWLMPGAFHLTGKEAFDKEIENAAFTGAPTVRITRMIEENDVVIAEGTVRVKWKAGGFLNAVFCDAFEMEDARIKRLITYQVNLKDSV